MLYMRTTAGCTLSEYERNEDILRELQIPQVTGFMEQCRRNWKVDIDRMRSRQQPKNDFLKYQLNGRSSSGRPLISVGLTQERQRWWWSS
jgi:hypothetical protein